MKQKYYELSVVLKVVGIFVVVIVVIVFIVVVVSYIYIYLLRIFSQT